MPTQKVRATSITEPQDVLLVPVERLRKSFSALRGSFSTVGPECELKPLPLRVVAADDGGFEILDGFKRFAAWQAEGRRHVPVMIESPGSSADHKRLLLLANAPRRTLTPLDEALVVDSLLKQDGLSLTAAAKLLGHKKEWVMQRQSIAQGLSVVAQKKVASREIGPTLAHHLTSLPPEDQDKLLECFSFHRVRRRDQLVVLQGYRVADATDRRRLLASPMSMLSPKPAPAFSPRLRELEQRLSDISRAISDLGAFRIPPDLPPNERHRLAGLIRQLLHEAKHALSAHEIPQEENTHEFTTTQTAATPAGSRSQDSGADSGDGPSRQHSPDLGQSGDFPDHGRAGARAGRAQKEGTESEIGQTRRIPEGRGGAGRQGADRNPDSARDPGTGVSGETNDPGRGSQSIAGSCSACSPPSGQAAV